MTNDVAIFLDLDNLVIGAKQLNVAFDINLILDHIKEITKGRILLRRAYGDSRQDKKLLKELSVAGFVTQATVRINNFAKNLADMQIVVDTMDTLIDGQQYGTYVFMTGDRDFTPLVQSLHKRSKHVIGIGMKHAASRSLVQLCDHYIFYDDLVPTSLLSETQIKDLLKQALDSLLKSKTRVRASILKQQMHEASNGTFDNSHFPEKSFRKFLTRYSDLVELQQEGTTTYVLHPKNKTEQRPLHLHYRSGLKRQRLRVPPANKRLTILKDLIAILKHNHNMRWRQLIDTLAEQYRNNNQDISKNVINSVLLVAREAQVIRSLKGRTLASAPVLLQLEGDSLYQEAIIRCDAIYLQGILDLAEPFQLEEAAIALYDNVLYSRYLQKVMDTWMGE